MYVEVVTGKVYVSVCIGHCNITPELRVSPAAVSVVEGSVFRGVVFFVACHHRSIHACEEVSEFSVRWFCGAQTG